MFPLWREARGFARGKTGAAVLSSQMVDGLAMPHPQQRQALLPCSSAHVGVPGLQAEIPLADKTWYNRLTAVTC